MAANRHIQYCITFFSHSWRCHTQVLWFWKRSISQVLRIEVPQPIHHALCANDRLMHKRHQKQREAAGMKRSESTVKGCDLKDCKAVIRIFNQDFHNSSRYKARGGCISSSGLPAVGIASSKALKRGYLKALYLQKRYDWIFGEWKIFWHCEATTFRMHIENWKTITGSTAFQLLEKKGQLFLPVLLQAC